VISTDRGGPGYVVNETCGLKVSAQTPQQLAEDLCSAIRTLAWDVDLRARLGKGARARVEEIGLWTNKMEWLVGLYDELIDQHQPLLQEVS
jgi:glycosyltransferase involved in cell wall biosynthesis